MALDELKNKIKKESEAEIARLRSESKQKIKEIESRIESEAKAEEDKITANAEKNSRMLEKQITGKAELELSRRVSTEKNRLLEEFFNSLCDRIMSLPDDGKRKLMSRLLKDAELLGPDAVIHVNGKYRGLVDSKLEVTESGVSGFGVVIESKDGSARIDNTLHNFISQLKPALKPKAGSILFK
jgi:vacuolar-type H+-ATPase subunit E/Vma4